ncbi:MAG: radical SAM protein [Kiritimatiellia bacterium]|jgi:wyosine [tRNA(Phe)-imidazoG37] synthetase (radical SAM superfamily)|nr:radical SAM protein [Kiritimatiellia bacterium]
MPDYRYLFGPVPSRRFGRSLGVDLTPLKTCSFNCPFCQLGPTEHSTLERRDYVPIADVQEEILRWREAGGRADYATLSGSGEPTLHTGFGAILQFLKAELPCPCVLLTNGSLLDRPEVRDAACHADVAKLSLSAWDDASFQAVNRPHPDLNFERMVAGMQAFRRQFTGQIWLEVFLMAGLNDTPGDVARIAPLAASIGPDIVHLNTAVRPPADSTVQPVGQKHMEALAGLFHPRAEVIANFSAAPGSTVAVTETGILEMLRRRPCTAGQLAGVLGLHLNEVAKYTGHLISEGRIQALPRGDEIYYEASRTGASGHN